MADKERSMTLIGYSSKPKGATYRKLSFPLLLAGMAVLFGAALVVGIVIGWKLLSGTQNVQQLQPNWGSTVNNGSQRVSVGDWLDDFISLLKIQDNLKCV